MSDETATTDDQSHYEISLTAGQAFIAFVLVAVLWLICAWMYRRRVFLKI